MAPVKRFGFHLLGFVLATVWSCNGGHSHASERLSDYKSVDITINSPYACYNEIQMDQTGAKTHKKETNFKYESYKRSNRKST
jgi:hypothetical protein